MRFLPADLRHTCHPLHTTYGSWSSGNNLCPPLGVCVYTTTSQRLSPPSISLSLSLSLSFVSYHNIFSVLLLSLSPFCFSSSLDVNGRTDERSKIKKRGEFSFFIAQEASEEGILTTGDYSAVVWALLLSSVAAPVFFRRVLARDQEDLEKTRLRRKEAEQSTGYDASTGLFTL